MKTKMNAKLWTWLVCIVTACALLGCADAQVQLPRLPQQATILAFGDSLTHGTGATRAHSYPAVLQTLTGRTVVNSGVPGETTAQGLQRLPSVLQKIQPDLVLLCLGGNDFLRHQDAEQTRDNLAAMLTLIQAQHISVVLLAVPRPRLRLRDEPLYKVLAEEYAVALAGNVFTDVLSKKALKADTVHPNAAGYRQVAEALAQFLRARGAI